MSETTRRAIVDQIRHSAALEGQFPSPEQEELMELWIQGKMSIDELIEMTLARYRNGESSAGEIKG